MKRFLYRTIFIFIIPVLIILLSLELSLRNSPNDYAYKRDWMLIHNNIVKVLNLGSSHAYFGINPQFFSSSAFNLAFTSQDLKYDHFLYHQYALQFDSLQHLILPISYFTLRSDMEAGGEWWRAKGYCIYMGCEYHNLEPRYLLESLSKDKNMYLLDALLGKADFRSCNELGYGLTNNKDSRQDDWSSSGVVAAQRHTSIHQERVEINLQYLEEIIQSCGERGVKVLLLTTPTYHTYVEHVDTYQLDEMTNICERLDCIYEHVVYLNWLQHEAFTEDDFYDADHLNEFGAEKLTRMLDDYLLLWQ